MNESYSVAPMTRDDNDAFRLFDSFGLIVGTHDDMSVMRMYAAGYTYSNGGIWTIRLAYDGSIVEQWSSGKRIA